MVFEYNEDANTLIGSEVSDDGIYLLITLSKDCNPTNRLYVADLSQGNGFGYYPSLIISPSPPPLP